MGEAMNDADTETIIKRVEVARLLLDPLNPRLTSLDQNATQVEILRELYRRYDLVDLLESLARNAYFDEEPLIAAPYTPGRKDLELVVVEGNRRLAALRLLLFEEARKAVAARGIPSITEEIRGKLERVPVKIYDNRDQIVPYLGVRHIAGVKPWDSLAKATYIRTLAEQGYPLEEVARMVGMKTLSLVSRWVLTLYLIEQANSAAPEPWDETERKFSFSLLHTALSYRSILNRLGITREQERHPRSFPVPEENVPSLLSLMQDIYGEPSLPDKAVIEESRELKELSAVYGNSEAYDYLRAGASLEEAYARTTTEREELIELLRTADLTLDRAMSRAVHNKGFLDAMSIAQRCQQSLTALMDFLKG